jgi:S1-C subfamily serine protease
MNRLLRLLGLGLPLLALATVLPLPDGFSALDRTTRIRAMKGVVLILILKKQGGKAAMIGHGSGSIISSDGLILTNNHVVADTKTNKPYDALAVCLTTSFDKTPRPTCIAYPSRAIRSPALDLAVIKCEAEVNGKPLRRKIRWPAVPRGDSSSIVPGDDLYVVGYPGIGGSTITFTSGKASGFLDDKGVRRAWIKTDALISQGVSGGAAFDDSGKLVGVPTLYVARKHTNIGMVRPINRGKKLIGSVVGKNWKNLPRAAAPAAPSTSKGDAGRIQLGPVNVTGGLSEAAVTRALQGRLTAVGACNTDASQRGYMDIQLSIGTTGRVRRARLQRTTITDRAMARCVGRAVLATSFPTAARATSGNVLLLFMGGAGGAGGARRPAAPPRATPPPKPPPPPPEASPPPRLDPDDDDDDDDDPPASPEPRYGSGLSYVSGQLRDASTRRPIIGGVVLILKPGVRVSGIDRDNLRASTATVAVSTSLGYFRTKHPLRQGKNYSILVIAKGYRLVAVDNGVKLYRGTPPVLNLGVLRLRRQRY